MARVTVEDCILKIPNRFDLVMVAAQRARKIGSGSALTLDRDNDKNPVVALREIAEDTVSVGDLQEELIRTHQRIIQTDDSEDEVIDLMEGEVEWAAMASRSVEDDMDAGDDFEGDDEPSLEDIAGGAEDDE